MPVFRRSRLRRRGCGWDRPVPVGESPGRLRASNLVADDQNGWPDVFLWDRETATTWCLSRNLAGLPANRSSCSENQEGVVNPTGPAMSADGRYVAFDSWADDLVPNDTNGRRDVFVFDRLTGTTMRASVSTEGEQTTGWWEWSGQSWEPAISGDGRLVAFTSDAINLVEDGLSDTGVFLRDLAAGETKRISACTCSESPAQPDDESVEPAFSRDHHILAFRSLASDLVPGRKDLNFSSDIFVASARRVRRIGITTAFRMPRSKGLAGMSLIMTATAMAFRTRISGRLSWSLRTLASSM